MTTRSAPERATGPALRSPQQERSRLTREALLRSTVEVLSTEGWAAATVATVAQRAGVSRGAAQHHFPTREDLITAALEQIFEDLTANASTAADVPPPGPDRIRAAVQRAVEVYVGPEFKASLQVWAAAASDPVLRERILPLEAKFARAAHRMTVAMLDPDGTDPRARDLARLTLDLARGLGLADTLSDDSTRRTLVVDSYVELLQRAE